MLVLRLRAAEVGTHWRLIACASIAKLVLTPLLVYVSFIWLFPEAPPVSRGVAVLLMATPMAVAAFVMCKQQKAHLVVSTGISCIVFHLVVFFGLICSSLFS